MIKQHVFWGGKGWLRFLSSTGIQFVFGYKAQLLHKVFLPYALLNQLLQLFSVKRKIYFV